MTPQDRDRLDAVTDALARMVRRQQDIDERLKRVEQGLAAAGFLSTMRAEPPPAPERPAPPPPVYVAPAPPPPVYVAPAPPPPEAAAPPYPIVPEPPPSHVEAQRPDIESAFGLTWISRIGALTLVIGVAFFFKYAFENRWITETGRVLLGLVVAAGMLAAGERFWRKSQPVFGQALTAIGICFFYLSFWAAHSLYDLIGQSPAFLLMTLTTIGAAGLAHRYNGQAMAAIGLLGGFMTPLLLEAGRNPWFILGYALLLAIGGYWLAQRWRYLQILTFIGSMALYATQWANPIPHSDRFLFTFFAVAFYGLFITGPLTGVALAAQLFFPILMAAISEPDLIALLPALAVAAVGLIAADRRGSSWFVIASYLGWWLAYAAWWEAGRKHNSIWGPFCYQAAAYLIYLAWPVYRRVVRGLPLRLTELMLAGANAALFFGTGYALLENSYRYAEGFFALAVAVTQMAAAVPLWSHDRRAGMLSAGAAWTMLVLAAPIQFTGYRVTMAWALEAAALAWIGDRLRDERVSASSLLVSLLVILRLLVEDSWMFPRVDYTALFNTRFFTFTVSAAALFATAIWTREQWRAATAYICGHFVLIWALCLEVSGWVARSLSIPESLQSAQSTSISILIAVYAVMMVAGGVVKRHGLTRVIGIVLILFVVAKLYLYDVWQLRPFYRIVAFAALGVALLSTASVYSRYRDRIGSWWRPE